MATDQLSFGLQPAAPSAIIPEVLTFKQFTARRGYDVEISHDRLRFPHGISKRQARDNHMEAILRRVVGKFSASLG